MVITVLAGNTFGDNMPDGLVGPTGLLIIVLLVIATVLLIRNMNSRLRRLPERFPRPDDPAATDSGPARAESAVDKPSTDL